ncbi:hypothetical protein IL306_000816 [Fusarium sp. DS 682]|nr:hypothetical protein IL306_000816 [Fusarium sp. DS 682]
MPFRRREKPRTDSQSPKRDNSGSASPDKEGFEEGQDISDMIVPVTEEEINRSYAQRIMDSFRSSVMVSAKRCAVSGKGQSWCVSPAIGPSLPACHIIPQQQFHLYPGSQSSDDTRFSSRMLREAWMSTWAPSNGILMMSLIHDLFDSRLLSIHPETLRIRAFVPYDAILDYHGCVAKVPEDVDRAALAHHYQMCCIENMAAKMPYQEIVTSLASRAATSGTNSPFTARPDIPATPGPDIDPGDPYKRSRSSLDGTEKRQSGSQPHDQDDGADMREHKQQRADESITTWEFDNYSERFITPIDSKRRRVVESEITPWESDNYSERFITPINSHQFLADVNFELGKLGSHGQ